MTPHDNDSPASDSDGPLPDFFHLLGEAFEASEAVDHYDLYSADPTSARQFALLEHEQAQAVERLVRHCQKFGDAVIDALRAS